MTSFFARRFRKFGAGNLWATLIALILTFFSSGCATLFNFDPAESIPPASPPRSAEISNMTATSLRHPEDFSISGLEGLFSEKSTPQWDAASSLKCEEPILLLQGRTNTHEELAQGVRELVKSDPALFHWCFYGKLLELEKSLGNENFILEKQALVLKTFKVIAPISKAFLSETLDSRYYRYSIRRYQELTQRVFFRKIEVLPEVTERLVNINQWPSQAPEPQQERRTEPTSILSKHGVAPVKNTLSAPATEDIWKELDRYPANEEDAVKK